MSVCSLPPIARKWYLRIKLPSTIVVYFCLLFSSPVVLVSALSVLFSLLWPVLSILIHVIFPLFFKSAPSIFCPPIALITPYSSPLLSPLSFFHIDSCGDLFFRAWFPCSPLNVGTIYNINCCKRQSMSLWLLHTSRQQQYMITNMDTVFFSSFNQAPIRPIRLVMLDVSVIFTLQRYPTHYKTQ